MKHIPYAVQSINEDDIAAVVDVLYSDWLTTGPNVDKFERTVAEYCCAKYAVAVNSATSALHIACIAAGLGEGDYLWTSPNTFVASANCGLYCGAGVDFVDIDPKTYNMSVEHLRYKLEQAAKQGKLPKVIIPVHFAGQSCEMAEIKNLSKKYGFAVIEDASHAIGGSYRGGKIGSCAWSDMTVFSFHPVKIITTGEGGMVVTNNEALYERLVRLRSHGLVRQARQMTEEPHGSWYYQQADLGFNYRITDLQAALGVSQMARIDDFLTRRRDIATRYNRAFAGQPLILPYQHSDTSSAWHLYVIKVQTPTERKAIFDGLRERGIGVNVHYIPVHTQPYYTSKFSFAEDICPSAIEYYRDCISLPMYYRLEESDQDYVIRMVKEVLA
ncbi:UDP-4-amino-4,6-dideoxy-N-acetyl-beta-L-altrosamine transaminase [Desulfosporosinus fructosivorans]